MLFRCIREAKNKRVRFTDNINFPNKYCFVVAVQSSTSNQLISHSSSFVYVLIVDLIHTVFRGGTPFGRSDVLLPDAIDVGPLEGQLFGLIWLSSLDGCLEVLC